MNPPASIDLNADVGEGFASEAQLVPLVSSVNIACGAHAGDLGTMRATVALALRHGAAIGAHPGFADRGHFGRRELPITPSEAAELVVGQTRLLVDAAAGLGARVGHVKLHGALYNMAARDKALARAVAEALAGESRRCGSRWVLFALAGSELVAAGRAAGLEVLGEAFADRAYRPDGTLVPRTEPGAVIADADDAARQAVGLAREGSVRAVGGAEVRVAAGTICIHGDSTGAVEFAFRVRRGLEAAGIAVRHPSW